MAKKTENLFYKRLLEFDWATIYGLGQPIC